MSGILELQGVTKKYGNKVALDNIDLSLPKGSIIGLLGPNGSGKTTMLKLAEGLLTPTAGTITTCGYKPGKESKALVAYQSDTVFVNDWMTVEQYFKMMQDFFDNFNMAKADKMLESLKLERKQRIKTLSKGNKEKIQLIATMARDVPLYILDEPIGGVDPAARDYILNTILTNYSEDSSVIISTHLISDVENVLNYSVFLNEGKIVRQGDVDEIREETGMSLDGLFRQEFKNL